MKYGLVLSGGGSKGDYKNWDIILILLLVRLLVL